MSDSSMQNDGPPPYRTPHSMADSIPIPSVGSPTSAAPSPLLDSAQTSVPPQDQVSHRVYSNPSPVAPVGAISSSRLLSFTYSPSIYSQFMHGMSPHPQGVNTPLTPSLENADKNTPAPTPTDQHESRVPESPYTQPNIVNSVEPPQNLLSSQSTSEQTPIGNGTAPNGGGGGNNGGSLKTSTPKPEPASDRLTAPGPSSSDSSITSSIVSLLKRPALSSRDYENIVDDDYKPRQLLYDYTVWDAWGDHPVKRRKPNDDKQLAAKQAKGIDLYADEVHSRNFELSDQVMALPANILADVQIKQEVTNNHFKDNELIVKSELMDDDLKSGNLLTEKGLQPSINDLDQIFDNSDDASSDETVSCDL